jgi:GTP-binding protein
MLIKNAEFVKSSTTEEQCPQSSMPEYAFIGRSNVGKSSLINMLTGRKKLAKTSSTPGKTRAINHFLVNDAWYIVDLPGYGYAKRSKKERAEWQAMMDDYFEKRENLVCVFVLLDARRDPQKNDLDFMRYLGGMGVPFVMVFTKIDKIGKMKQDTLAQNYKTSMQDEWEFLPQMFFSSAVNKEGQDSLLAFVEQTNRQFNRSK